jgi:hypothetical protein
MPARASVTMRGPPVPGMVLEFDGSVTSQQLSAGPVTLKVTVEGVYLGAANIHADDFALRFGLPDELVGKPQVILNLEVNRVFHPAGDDRKLGLSFGLIAIR